MNYFNRVKELSDTKFWINNPTRKEAEMAISEGAVSCTLNPQYSQKMLDNPEESEYAYSVLDRVISEISDDIEAAREFQRRLAAPICKEFMKIYSQTDGEHGYVSIQCDPNYDEDAEFIVEECLKNRTVSENVCCKIPVNEAGLKAIEKLIPENAPINATEVFAMDQGIVLGELRERVLPKGQTRPKMWYSHIAGIYDEYLKNKAKEEGIDIPQDYFAQAGLICSRKLYHVVKERGYRMDFIGGGARAPYHFTELVGGDVNLTINWRGTADILLRDNPPVVFRIDNPTPKRVVDELCRLDDFKRGYYEGSMQIDEFEDFGPVQLFKGNFVTSWNRVLGIIKQRREGK